MSQVALALTFLNLALLCFSLGVAVPISATGDAVQSQAPPPVVRTRMLELVDEQGKVRSLLRVEPDGEVVFRLTDPEGQIRVKLGAGNTGSGLVLLDEKTEPAVHLLARRSPAPDNPATTSVVVAAGNDRRQVIKP